MKYSAVIINNGYLEVVFNNKADAETWAFTLNNQTKDPVCAYYNARAVTGLKNICRATNYQYTEKEIKRRFWYGC